MGFSRIGAAGVLTLALTACSGAGSSAPPALVTLAAPAAAPLVQQGMPVPFNPATDSLASLGHVTLASVSSSAAGLLSSARRRSAYGLVAQSTIQPGDPGFFVGLRIKESVTAIYAIFSAYSAGQFSIPYPPTGSPTPPVKPERFFGPEIEPGASCLTAGLVMVNFGPGGTQRNGPGNPIQSLVGPYNAYRVLDFCNPTPDATGKPPPVTFFLTPLHAKFIEAYVRPNESGLPSVVSEVFSENRNAFENPRATWHAILWNFETHRWDVTNTSHGNVGGPGIPGDVLAYSVPVNVPEVCPTIPPLIAQDINVLDPVAERFVEPGRGEDGRLAHALLPGENDPYFGTNSKACFVRDSSGDASYTFDFAPGKGRADWVLKQAAAAEPAPR